MAAETTFCYGRDTLKRISQPPPSSAQTRVTRVERCKVATFSAIGAVYAVIDGCVYDMCRTSIHSFFSYRHLLPRGIPLALPANLQCHRRRPSQAQTCMLLQQPHRRAADEARRCRRAWLEQRTRFRRRVYHSVHGLCRCHTHTTTTMHEECEAKTEDDYCAA